MCMTELPSLSSAIALNSTNKKEREHIVPFQIEVKKNIIIMEKYFTILMEYGDGCNFGIDDVLIRICLKDDIEKNLREIISENTGLSKDDLIIEYGDEDSYGTIAYHVFNIVNGTKRSIYGEQNYSCYYTKPLVNFIE